MIFISGFVIGYDEKSCFEMADASNTPTPVITMQSPPEKPDPKAFLTLWEGDFTREMTAAAKTGKHTTYIMFHYIDRVTGEDKKAHLDFTDGGELVFVDEGLGMNQAARIFMKEIEQEYNQTLRWKHDAK